MPGHGASAPAVDPDTYSIVDLTRIVRQVIEKLAVTDLVIVGHSLGGHIAMELLDKVSGLKGIMVVEAPALNKPAQLEAMFQPNPVAMHFFNPALTPENIAELAQAMLY